MKVPSGEAGGPGSLRGLRVLVIATSPFFMVRGSPLRTLGFVERYLAEGCTVHVLTYPVGADISREGLVILRPHAPWYRRTLPGPSISKLLADLLLLRRAARLLEESSYDLVHCEDSEAAAIGVLLKRRFKARIVADFHNRLSDNLALHGWRFLVPLARWVERFLYHGADHVITNNEAFRNFLRERYGLESVSVVPDSLTDREAEPGILLPPRYLAYSGNSASYQGIPLLLRAFAGLPPGHREVKLVLVGDMSGKVERLVNKLGLRDRVLTPGVLGVEETNHVLRRSLFNVLPSMVSEDLPHMKCAQYLAAGAPILATGRRGSRRPLRHLENAYLVEPEPAAICRGMVELLEDPAMMERLSRRAAPAAEEADGAGLLETMVGPVPRAIDGRVRMPAAAGRIEAAVNR